MAAGRPEDDPAPAVHKAPPLMPPVGAAMLTMQRLLLPHELPAGQSESPLQPQAGVVSRSTHSWPALEVAHAVALVAVQSTQAPTVVLQTGAAGSVQSASVTQLGTQVSAMQTSLASQSLSVRQSTHRNASLHTGCAAGQSASLVQGGSHTLLLQSSPFEQSAAVVHSTQVPLPSQTGRRGSTQSASVTQPGMQVCSRMPHTSPTPQSPSVTQPTQVLSGAQTSPPVQSALSSHSTQTWLLVHTPLRQSPSTKHSVQLPAAVSQTGSGVLHWLLSTHPWTQVFDAVHT